MPKHINFLLISLMSLSLINCNDGSKGSKANGGSTTETTNSIQFNGNNPQEYYSQFNAEAINCDDNSKSKLMKFPAIINKTIKNETDIEAGTEMTVYLFMADSKFRTIIDISENIPADYGDSKNIIASSVIEGTAQLKNGQVILTSDTGAHVFSVGFGLRVNGEELVELQILNAVRDEVDQDFAQEISPVLNKSILMGNIERSLTEEEGVVACSQGIGALLF